ncbi:helix-turn-helix domain-containing protein [Pseudarthrobacter siccitolerans]
MAAIPVTRRIASAPIKQPKLSKMQRSHLLKLHDAGEYTQAELAELFEVSRKTVFRELQRRTH